MKRNAVPMIYPGAGKSSKGGIGQIRFVLRVGLPIVQLDINVARRDRAFFIGDPDLSKVLRATQSAKALDAISGGVEEIAQVREAFGFRPHGGRVGAAANISAG